MKKLSLILALFLILASLGCVQTGIAFAASETVYTGVLEDLLKDEAFDVSKYPSKDKLSDNDKVMDVIQIAESNAGELFLYVYQPHAGKFTATEARISQTIEDNIAPEDYKLTLLSREGALEKYKVEQLQLKSDAVRYYIIVQLARPWDKELDISEEKDSNNTSTTKPYPIGKKFTACTIDGKVSYIEEHTEVITIEDKWFGFLRYSNGFKLYTDSCDSWFIAFNTDMPISNLYDADVTFMSQRFSYYRQYMFGWQVNENFTDKEPTGPHKVKLSETDTATTKADGLFAYKYSWNRIESVSDFKRNETLSKEYLDNLEGKEWVLRFTETDFEYFDSTYTGTQNYTVISDVTILRLHFKSNGKVYNLGVVDDKVSNPDGPINEDTEPIDGLVKRWEAFLEKLEIFWDNVLKAFKWLAEHWWVIIAGIVAIALIVGLIIAIVKKGAAVVFKAVGVVLWWVLKIVFYIVTLPVWLIIWGVRAIKKNKQ